MRRVESFPDKIEYFLIGCTLGMLVQWINLWAMDSRWTELWRLIFE